MHTVLDLFAGIGGFSLGLERVGGGGYFKTGAFCEIDSAACRVLTKHWPEVRIYKDIKRLTYEQLKADGVRPTVFCIGFPCTDISNAGHKKGIHGESSSLWKEAFRLLQDVPQAVWVLTENVPPLRSRGATLVLQNLSEIGFCSELHCIPAYAVGSPQSRDRLFIISYRHPRFQDGQEEKVRAGGDALGALRPRTPRLKKRGALLEGYLRELITKAEPWPSEFDSGVLRISHGVSNRLDRNRRIKQLGNAVVPQIPQLIGQAIMEYEKNE